MGLKDDPPTVSEQIRDQIAWLDTSENAVDRNAEFDQNAPDETVVRGKTETKFNPSEGDNSPHEDGVNYYDLHSANDEAFDETRTERRRSHIRRDAETWMDQLELFDYERERVKHLINETDFSVLGRTRSETVVLAYIVIVILERDRIMGGWFWDDVAEIESATGVSHNDVLQLCKRLTEDDDQPSVNPSFPNL